MKKFLLLSQNQAITLLEDVVVVPNHQNPKGIIKWPKKKFNILLENRQKEMVIDPDRRCEILKNQPEKNPAVNHPHPKLIK